MTLVPGTVLVPTAQAHTASWSEPPGPSPQPCGLACNWSPGPSRDRDRLLGRVPIQEGNPDKGAGGSDVAQHPRQQAWKKSRAEHSVICGSDGKYSLFLPLLGDCSRLRNTDSGFLPPWPEVQPAYSAPLPEMAVVSLPQFPSGRPWPSWVPGLGWASLPPWPHSQASYPVSCLESDHRQPLPTHSLKGCPFWIVVVEKGAQVGCP